MKNLEISAQITQMMNMLNASSIRDAVAYAQAKLDAGADPCETLCIIEDYANSIDPDHKSNVVPIDGALS